jgi:hypothetical protein
MKIKRTAIKAFSDILSKFLSSEVHITTEEIKE